MTFTILGWYTMLNCYNTTIIKIKEFFFVNSLYFIELRIVFLINWLSRLLIRIDCTCTVILDTNWVFQDLERERLKFVYFFTLRLLTFIITVFFTVFIRFFLLFYLALNAFIIINTCGCYCFFMFLHSFITSII